MSIRSHAPRRRLRTLCVAVIALSLALTVTPAEGAKKSPTQVRRWSTATQTVAPGTTVEYSVKVTSRGKPSRKRLVILQRHSRGAWIRVAQRRSSRYGNATLPMKVGRAGVTHRLRIKVTATRTNRARVTRARKVVVRAAASSATARQILTLVNEARASGRTCGGETFAPRGPLSLDARLNAAAQGHARDMARHDRFSHEGRDGSSVGDRVTRAGYAWRAVGENIAAGQQTPQQVMHGWLASAGHCRNIMSGSYAHLGVGRSTDAASTYGIYWVQNFAAPR